mmetsp:Transcript_7999/g.14649  ORF Transcript_7999/g.14649 Transcript_7999/m.14649 type:complete len:96 (-) Transcript_7999:138-425(-)
MGIAMFVSSVMNIEVSIYIWVKSQFAHFPCAPIIASTYPKNQPLAYWVFKQRGQYRIFIKGGSSKDTNQSSHMTPDRIRALDEIGFEWNPPRRTK